MKTRVMQDDPDGGVLSGAPRTRPAAPVRPRGRVAARAATAALGVCALALGGVLLGVDAGQRDADGFYGAEGGALATTTHALVSHDLDVATGGPDWILNRLGELRVTATGARDGPVFVGIGRRTDVDAYLAGVPHEVTDFDGGGARSSVTGGGAPAPPASQGFWARSAGGAGTQTVVWPVEAGDWAAVVMNADGSPGVSTDTRVAVSTDVVLWMGGGLILAGVALLGSGGALLASGRRRGPEAARHAGAAT